MSQINITVQPLPNHIKKILIFDRLFHSSPHLVKLGFLFNLYCSYRADIVGPVGIEAKSFKTAR